MKNDFYRQQMTVRFSNKRFEINDHYFHRRLTTAIITFTTKQDSLYFNKTISSD